MAGGQEQTPLKNNASVLICVRQNAGSPLALSGRLSWTGWGASPFRMLGTHRDTESESQMPAASQAAQPVDHGHPAEPCTIFCELCSEQTEMSFPAQPKPCTHSEDAWSSQDLVDGRGARSPASLSSQAP